MIPCIVVLSLRTIWILREKPFEYTWNQSYPTALESCRPPVCWHSFLWDGVVDVDETLHLVCSLFDEYEYVGVHKQNYLMHFLQTALNCERTRFAITFNRNAIRQLGMLWPLDRCRDPRRHSCRTQLNRIFSHQRRFQMPDQSVWERTLCYKSEQCVPLHKWFNGLDMLVGLSNNKKSETSGPALSLKRFHSQAVNTATMCCGWCHETNKQSTQN